MFVLCGVSAGLSVPSLRAVLHQIHLQDLQQRPINFDEGCYGHCHPIQHSKFSQANTPRTRNAIMSIHSVHVTSSRLVSSHFMSSDLIHFIHLIIFTRPAVPPPISNNKLMRNQLSRWYASPPTGEGLERPSRIMICCSPPQTYEIKWRTHK